MFDTKFVNIDIPISLSLHDAIFQIEVNESVLACPLKLDPNRQWAHRVLTVRASEAEPLQTILSSVGHRSCSSPNDFWVVVEASPSVPYTFPLNTTFPISLTFPRINSWHELMS